MTFSITLLIISYSAFFIFADKKKLHEFIPTCFLAMILGLATDLLIHHYPLWDYPARTEIHSFWKHLSDDLGVYPIVTYLYLQTLPKKQTVVTVMTHTFYWSILGLIIEIIAIKTKAMRYGLWWTLGHSYIADWILYLIFYGFYKLRNRYGTNYDLSKNR